MSPLARPMVATLALGAAGLVALAGCTRDEPAPSVSPTPVATSTPTPTPTAAPTPTPVAAVPFEVGAAPELTPEGTRLAVADEAVLQRSSGADPAAATYTEARWASRVVEVVPADPAPLVEVVGPEAFDPATQQAFYVRTTHRLLWARGSSDAVPLAPPHVLGWGADGAGASEVRVMGVFAPCRTDALAEPAIDAEVAACTIAVLPAGQPLGYVGVDANPQLGGGAPASATSVPVVWVLLEG